MLKVRNCSQKALKYNEALWEPGQVKMLSDAEAKMLAQDDGFEIVGSQDGESVSSEQPKEEEQEKGDES